MRMNKPEPTLARRWCRGEKGVGWPTWGDLQPALPTLQSGGGASCLVQGDRWGLSPSNTENRARLSPTSRKAGGQGARFPGEAIGGDLNPPYSTNLFPFGLPAPSRKPLVEDTT